MSGYDHHPPCHCGCGELADECAGPRPSPLGSLRLTTHDQRGATVPYRPIQKQQRTKPKRRPPVSDCLHEYHRVDPTESRCIYCGDLRDDR